jgi:hypothetical protein
MTERPGTAASQSRRRRGARVLLGLFLGCLLVQSAWILALPPFRGTDEFDHAYRAAEVAGGEWLSNRAMAEHGRGHLVAVPKSIVSAAHRICASYTYTGPDNCTPVQTLDDGRVLVASAASAYNPFFYWVVGTAAKPFDGAQSLYAMRIASALLCAALIALAGWTTSLWARTAWPVFGLLLAMTPVMVFSISIAAPNGLEMSAALGLWCALIGLSSDSARSKHATALVVVASVNAIIVTTLRSIGPLWVALIVITAAIYVGRPAIMDLVRTRRTPLLVCSVLVAGATVASVMWTRISRAAELVPDSGRVVDPWRSTFHQIPWWLFQGVAAFPRRNIPAPPIVYVLVFFALLGVAVAGLISASTRLRVTLLVCVAASLLVPVALTRLSIETTGPMWQGRYGLPYHMGITLLACRALDLRSLRRLDRFWLSAAYAAVATADVVSITHVFDVERLTSPLAGSTEWHQSPGWLLLATATLGCCAWASTVRASASSDAQRIPRPELANLASID